MTLFIIAATITSVNAQYVSIQNTNYGASEATYNSELRTLQKFENKLDQFSYSLMVNDVWLARKNKKTIIRSMEQEINRTERKIKELTWDGNSYSKRNNQKKYRTRENGIYSKRNGNNYVVNQLYNQLEEQRWIKYKFESKRLIGSKGRGIINKKYHRKLMYQYRDLMRDKLEKPQRNQGERRG
ncbi:MAG: hypothetical protein BalsKO_05770 [Balneolaceae bacterium]